MFVIKLYNEIVKLSRVRRVFYYNKYYNSVPGAFSCIEIGFR